METKFKMGDTVFLLHNNRLERGSIIYIKCEQFKGKEQSEEYMAEDINDSDIRYRYSGKKLFRSREELIESL